MLASFLLLMATETLSFTPYNLPHSISSSAQASRLCSSSSALSETFFSSNAAYAGVFKRLTASHPTSFEVGEQVGDPVMCEELTSDGLPKANDKGTCETFLNYLQMDLLSSNPDDEDEESFIEAGRALMAINRFQVLQTPSVQNLFSACWTEIDTLNTADVPDSGTLILFPGLEEIDLDDWITKNIDQPLTWLGASSDWSIKSYPNSCSSPVPAVRLLFKQSVAPQPGRSDVVEIRSPEEDAALNAKVDAMYDKAAKQVRERRDRKASKQKPKGNGFGN